MPLDNYDPATALRAYFPSRADRTIARVWANEAFLHEAAALGVEFFEGSGSNPTTLTGYDDNKLWLRVEAGVTAAPGEVRYYTGVGDPTLLANWPIMNRTGLVRYFDMYSRTEIDALFLAITNEGLRIANVFEFGAVGNGSTDDTAAFQAAIDSIEASSNTTEGPAGMLFAPAGHVYRINSRVLTNIPMVQRIYGQIHSYVASGGTLTYGDEYFRNGRNWGYDVDIATVRSMVGNTAEPTTINETGACAVEIRAAQHSEFRIRRAIAFSRGGVYFNCTNNAYRATVTVTIASPAVVTWTGHGKTAGDEIIFATSGTLPTGITAGLTYYVSATGLTANTFQFSATNGGASVATSGAQAGTHTAGGAQHIQGNDIWIGETTYNGFGWRASSDDAALGAFQNNTVWIGNSHRNFVNNDVDLAGGGFDDTANNEFSIGSDAAAAGGTNTRIENGQFNEFKFRYMDGTLYYGAGANANRTIIFNNQTNGVTLVGNTAGNWTEMQTDQGIKVVSGQYNYDAGALTLGGAISATTQAAVNRSGGVATITANRTDTHGDAAAVGYVEGYGKDSAGNSELYARMDLFAEVDDSGAERGGIRGQINESGSLIEAFKVRFGGIELRNGYGLRTGRTASDTITLQAYNTGGSTYTTFATLTAGATPTMTLANVTFSSSLNPTTNDGGALGTGSLSWSDLFLATGGVINFGNGNATITHSTDLLSFGSRIKFYRNTSETYLVEYEQDGTGDAAFHLLLTGEAEAAIGLDNSDGNKFKISNTGDVGSGTVFTVDFANSQVSSSGSLKTATTTVASLPAAATAGAGARHMVTDATATTFQSIVAGGGANIVPVHCDGTNWRIG